MISYLNKIVNFLNSSGNEVSVDFEKRTEDLILRNSDEFDFFVKKVSQVNIFPYLTLEEIAEKEQDPNLQRLMYVPGLDALTGQKLVREYIEYITEFFNKILTKENRKDLFYSSKTLLGLDWSKKIENKKDAGFWIYLYKQLVQSIVAIHESRVLSKKNENAKIDQKREEEEELSYKNFLELNDSYIENYIEQSIREEASVGKYGLPNKGYFEDNLEKFIKDLAKNGEKVESYYLTNERRTSVEEHIRSEHKKKAALND